METAPICLDFLRHPGRRTAASPRAAWVRAVAGRLARAVRGAEAADVLAATALAIGLVEAEPTGGWAARRGAALLDAAAIAPGQGLDLALVEELAEAAEALLRLPADTPPDAVAQQLGGVLRDIARRTALRAGRPSPEVDIPAYVAQHLHDGVRLTDLARRLGYSASHCSALVRRTTGERFSALRRRMQLERAIGLLRTGTSVKEAAFGAGFSEPAYFSRVFSRRFGVPPSRWREVTG